MKIENRTFASGKWSAPLPSDLDSAKTLVYVAAAPEMMDTPAPFTELRKAFPQATIIGCSSSGEILGPMVNDKSVTVAIAKFDQTTLKLATATANAEAGQKLAHDLKGEGLRSVLVLSDGLAVNGTELVRGLNSGLADSVVVTGGLAGDGDRFKRTWVLDGETPKSGLVTAVGFYGDKLKVAHGSKGGWDKFGPERVVTKSEGNVLFELDGKPALTLYKEYLGDRAGGLPATGLLFPLAIRASQKDQKSLTRTILAIDEEKQSMTFAGDIPQGSFAQLMKANFERLIGGASEAALAAVTDNRSAPSGPTLAIAISCVGRRLVLGERADEELEATLSALPKDTTQIGFYSYGELSPYGAGNCDLHNQTMTLTLLSETA